MDLWMSAADQRWAQLSQLVRANQCLDVMRSPAWQVDGDKKCLYRNAWSQKSHMEQNIKLSCRSKRWQQQKEKCETDERIIGWKIIGCTHSINLCNRFNYWAVVDERDQSLTSVGCVGRLLSPSVSLLSGGVREIFTHSERYTASRHRLMLLKKHHPERKKMACGHANKM